MNKYIDVKLLYNQVAEKEELARQRVVDTPSRLPNGDINPYAVRYATQLDERTTFKFMLTDAPAADVVEMVRKPVVGYEGYYEVDQFGRVYALDRVITVNDNGRTYDKPLNGRQMKQSIHSKGYKTVSLTKDGKTKTIYVHRIVAEAFIPNPNALPFINHIDEDKTNNFVENLEWCTEQYNSTYGKARQKQAKALRGKKHTKEHNEKISESMLAYQNGENGNGQKVVCLESGQVFSSISECARAMGVPFETVRKSCIRKTKKGKLYTFRFADDYCSYGERKDG